jgi:hypothetical protein
LEVATFQVYKINKENSIWGENENSGLLEFNDDTLKNIEIYFGNGNKYQKKNFSFLTESQLELFYSHFCEEKIPVEKEEIQKWVVHCFDHLNTKEDKLPLLSTKQMRTLEELLYGGLKLTETQVESIENHLSKNEMNKELDVADKTLYHLYIHEEVISLIIFI